jgi:23S rRNA G2445 N2-methylase RlmL
MCGSGTFLIEAALMATNTAPGLLRQRWPFQSWPDFDPSAWHSSIDAARQARVKWDGLLLGNDVHQGALGLAKR